MANSLMKRCSVSLIITEMKIKTQWDITFCFTEWLSSVKHQTTNARVQTKDPLCTVGWNAVWCIHWENNMEFPQKLENVTDLWLSNSTSQNISEETWNTNLKEYIHSYVHRNIIYDSQDLEAAQVLITAWMDTMMWYIYTWNKLSHAKEGNLTFYNGMYWPGEYHAKWSKLVKER